MTRGFLHILVVEAHGLPSLDFLDKIDPYVVVGYKGQERKTNVALEQGGNPKWNEHLVFRAEYPGSGGDYKLIFKVMDHDTFSSDDFLGQTTIYVEDLLALGMEEGSYELRPTKYRLTGLDETYVGDIKVGIKFLKAMDDYDDEERIGGWIYSYGD